MPIQSLTGKPGNAKTAFMVKRILEEAAKPDARPLWAAGIDGLQPGLCNVFSDPRQWNAVRPGEVCTCNDTDNASTCDAHVIPNGSLIFIDEAWKWFGHLQDASRQSTPAHVLQLAEHRHRGLDFVWTYQQPNQIFPFARGLMAEHRHLVRKFGTMWCDAYDWQELCEDVKSQSKRDAAQKSTVRIPKETFGLYKSAEVHTIKTKLPKKLLLIPALLVGVVIATGFAYHAISPSTVQATVAGKDASGEAAAASPQARTTKAAYSTALEYSDAFTPRIPSMPWTAPGFDGRAVVADPHVYCMQSAAGLDAQGEYRRASILCVTEQGTPYQLPVEQAARLARFGEPYNPFKRPQEDRRIERERDPGAGQRPAAMAAPAAAPVGGMGQAASQVASYGSMGSAP